MDNEAVPLPKLAYTLDQTAEILSISRASVNRLIRDGALKAADLGHRTVRISPQAIEEMLRSHERQGDNGKTVKRFVRKGVSAD